MICGSLTQQILKRQEAEILSWRVFGGLKPGALPAGVGAAFPLTFQWPPLAPGGEDPKVAKSRGCCSPGPPAAPAALPPPRTPSRGRLRRQPPGPPPVPRRVSWQRSLRRRRAPSSSERPGASSGAQKGYWRWYREGAAGGQLQARLPGLELSPAALRFGPGCSPRCWRRERGVVYLRATRGVPFQRLRKTPRLHCSLLSPTLAAGKRRRH